MESWFCSCWIYLSTVIVLFRNISADVTSPPHYSVHNTQIGFDQAMKECSPGVLTTLATEQEVTDILQLVSKSVSPLNQKEFTFWVGLRKVKDQCVVPTLPLRGFHWTEDGSEKTQVSRWKEEPQETCTTVRCAALKGELDGSTVTTWGLIPVTCKNSYQFICKLTGDTSKPPKPATPESEPATPEPKPATPEPHNPEPRLTTTKPELSTLEPERPTPGSKLETDVKPDQQGPESDSGSVPATGSHPCQTTIIPGARSLSLDPNNSSRIQVECWSTFLLKLHCSGHPAMWRLLDDSPANFTTICQRCKAGFEKDTYGNCVDIDECTSGAPCRQTCLNTEGSYRCVCSDENGQHHDDDSPVCRDMLWGILIPVLGAVGALLVLVVVVAVTVKCCLMRRSKKRAIKKAEKMALKSKDDKEPANEKVAI